MILRIFFPFHRNKNWINTHSSYKNAHCATALILNSNIGIFWGCLLPLYGSIYASTCVYFEMNVKDLPSLSTQFCNESHFDIKTTG